MITLSSQAFHAELGRVPADRGGAVLGEPSAACVRDWLERIGRRDEGAMASLYGAFCRRVHAFVLNRCHDPALAEEVVVDTMFEVWRRPDRFRGESRFSTWLIGIARHKMIDAVRACGDRPDDLGDYEDVLAGPDQDAFDRVYTSQRRHHVAECLRRLPADQCEAMHLVLYQGFTLSEVAALQGVPENTVKTRLFHARRRLHSSLESWHKAESRP